MRKALFLLVLLAPGISADPLVVRDDTGVEVRLAAPPQRIVSLAPHLTEILFSLGVGDHIVATVQHSDYPEAARHIPRLGDAFSLGIEAVIGLSPDLILAWTTGGNARTVRRLQELGYSIYLNEAQNLDAIAGNVERIGRLVGEAQKGALLADGFRQSLSALRESKLTQERRSVFFQIADTQLYTVNDQHLIGQAITACGGGNIFGDLELMVPLVSLESIVEADPAIILVASPHKDFVSRWQDDWKRLGWQARIRYIDASLITRPSLRMLNGIKSLCKLL